MDRPAGRVSHLYVRSAQGEEVKWSIFIGEERHSLRWEAGREVDVGSFSGRVLFFWAGDSLRVPGGRRSFSKQEKRGLRAEVTASWTC